MSNVNFISQHGTAHLHGSEGHHLMHLPYAATLGFLPTGFSARQDLDEIIAPGSYLRLTTDAGFTATFTTAWTTGDMFEPHFAWRGHTLDTFQISLNTALAIGSDPLKFACRFAFAGYPWVDGPHRAWLADIIDAGQRAGLFRGPHQGWDTVAELLRSRDDGPVVIGDSTGSRDFPTPYLGGWFPPELGEDYTKLTEQQQREWEQHDAAWYDLDADERWRISMAALRAHPNQGLELRPDTWNDLHFGRRITVFDLLAHDRAERLDRAFGLTPATATGGSR